ncbi:protein smg8 [Aplysia californica]|uniref:Nonsense-mediated mRNA decay factor SMG8 n=1 Tax=Aplysia californica TaxID=6500 RepID=A0ABM1A4S0_APLCA|nr:protein smg8 [Aplysia californica]
MASNLHQLQDIFRLPVELPDGELLRDTPENKTNICIVAVIGKGRLNPFSSKATPLNPLIDRDVFHGTEGYLKEKIIEGSVECFYDADSKVMYAHLVSHYDVSVLVQQCQQLDHVDNSKNLYTVLQEEELRHAQHLLMLFSLSHIVLLCHPGGAFDLAYLKLFHTIDSIRLKLQGSLYEVLSSVPGVSKDWSEFGRVCTPRVLFLFETPSIDVQPEDGDAGSSKSNKKYPPMKKLQMYMEDVIYRILRRARAITNVSNNSLFSVPANMEFVYILCKRSEVSDPVDFQTQQLKQRCFPSNEENAPVSQKPRPYSASRRKLSAGIPNPLPLSAPSSLVAPSSHATAQGKLQQTSKLSATGLRWSQEQGLKEFLWQHIEMVFSKSINDNVGRHGVEPVFVLPTLSTWLLAANAMQKYFFGPDQSTDVHSVVSSLTSMLDISLRFSEARCKKVMPLAEGAYQQDLPPFYITAYHLNKLSKAKRVFSQYARGPATEGHLKELEKLCTDYWKAGRQQCEVLSLTGNLCNSKVHRLPLEDLETSGELQLSVSEHVSQLKTKAACNCGRMQMEKDDPFTHKFANYDFYQLLEAKCCGCLEHIPLPVFMPTTPDARAATVSVTPSSFSPGSQEQQQQQQQTVDSGGKDGGEKGDVFSTLSELSLALSLGQTGAGELDQKVNLLDGDREVTQPAQQERESTLSPHTAERAALASTAEVKPAPVRQHSTTEYLPYMMHSKAPHGLLPTFPSFSLCRLGAASFYSHMIGLELPGFLPGGNFLLPWDIAVKNEQEKWPTVSETFAGGKKRMQRKPVKAPSEGGDTMSTVRVYLGMEYECPRGHRFFCSGPDKVIKVSTNSIVKDNASRLVHVDMPLYTLCQCKQPKGCMSQMMRVYVVTPRDIPSCPSVRVLIQPSVQPQPHPCPEFHPGLDSPIELPHDGVWVLRLPHMYQDENCVYLMPNDPQQLHACHVPKGMFDYRIL